MRTFYLFFLVFIHLASFGQRATDSTVVPDTILAAGTDSIARQPDSTVVMVPTVRLNQDSINAVAAKQMMDKVQNVLTRNAYYRFTNPPLRLLIRERLPHNDEYIFYFLLGLLLFFAVIRIIFSKYLGNLMTLFFRVTMRQQQIREQVLQTPLPSLLLNVLFVISAGLYLTFIARYLHVVQETNQWLLLMYSIAFVSVIYAGKFIFLKFTGWIFNVAPATDTYIFIVFLVNKMIGIFMLPFLLIIAFPSGALYSTAVIVSFLLLGLLFLYRFFISYRPIRNEIKVGKFHFFLYLCAFEIAPLLLIYKVLLTFIERSS